MLCHCGRFCAAARDGIVKRDSTDSSTGRPKSIPPRPLAAGPAPPGGNPVPRWRQIALALAADIDAGRLAPGARLPGEARLAAEFGVNRHTLRQATQSLAAQGFVSIRPGSGVYVRQRVFDYPLRRQTRLTQNLADSGELPVRELLDIGQHEAGEWAEPLRLAPAAPVCRLRLRSLVRGRPIAISDAVFPLPRFAAIADRFARLRSISAAIDACGVRGYTRLRSAISARMPDVEEADWLERETPLPVLVVRYVNVDFEGTPVEAGLTRFASDALQLVVEGDE